MKQKHLSMESFCCQLHNRAPRAGDAYTLDKARTENLKKLCAYLINKSIPTYVIQEAVWCVSDDNSPCNITTRSADLKTRE